MPTARLSSHVRPVDPSMPHKNPRVSAIVLSYNRRDETLKCLTSLKEQDYATLEIVVVDNGSKDGSADAIQDGFPRVRLIRLPKNYGDWEGRDIALCNCTGEYVLCIDNDAVMEKTVVSKMVCAMENDPLLAVVEPRVVDPKSGEPFSVSRDWVERDHYRANFLGGAALYRTQTLARAGGFPHYLLGGAEAHLSLRFLDMGYRILHLGNCTIFHDMSPRERVPHHRYFLSAKQRLRAYMAHYPGVLRPSCDFAWKVAHYASGAIQRGFIFHLPKDLIALVFAGFQAWRCGQWRVKKETIHLHDYLRAHPVSSLEEYYQVSCQYSRFWGFLVYRFRRH